MSWRLINGWRVFYWNFSYYIHYILEYLVYNGIRILSRTTYNLFLNYFNIPFENSQSKVLSQRRQKPRIVRIKLGIFFLVAVLFYDNYSKEIRNGILSNLTLTFPKIFLRPKSLPQIPPVPFFSATRGDYHLRNRPRFRFETVFERFRFKTGKM